MRLDGLDEKILNALIENPERKLKKIAVDLKTTAPTVYSRMDKLKKAGVLKGLKPVINIEKLDYIITAVLQVNVKRGFLKETVKTLSNKASVINIFEVSGAYNVMAIAKMKSTSELKALIEELSAIEEVQDIETGIAYNLFKEEMVPFPLKVR